MTTHTAQQPSESPLTPEPAPDARTHAPTPNGQAAVSVIDEYRVCNRLLDPETNEHCEFDGPVPIYIDGSWHCPACGALRRKQ